MKICQHKDISPAQHLKIPLLDAYILTSDMVLFDIQWSFSIRYHIDYISSNNFRMYHNFSGFL